MDIIVIAWRQHAFLPGESGPFAQALKRASAAGIAVFYHLHDEGLFLIQENLGDIFVIEAFQDYKGGDQHVRFLEHYHGKSYAAPGHVPEDHNLNAGMHASSRVEVALASGLGALILYCIRIAIQGSGGYNAETNTRREERKVFLSEYFERSSTAASFLHKAFSRITIGTNTGSDCLAIWNSVGSVAERMKEEGTEALDAISGMLVELLESSWHNQ